MIKGLTLAVLLGIGTVANAGLCGGGKVTSILEGGWNNDDFYFKIDYSKYGNEHSGTEWWGWIRVQKDHVSSERLQWLKVMVYTAMKENKDIWTFTHSGYCSDVAEIGTGNRD